VEREKPKPTRQLSWESFSCASGKSKWDGAFKKKDLYRDEPNIVIADTMETSSMDGFGTEMILDDLQQQESPGDVRNRYTPRSLPPDEERSRPQDVSTYSAVGPPLDVSNESNADYNFSTDAFSFSDVNIIVDDASSHASSSPMFLQHARRSYSVPDTVNL
jgi:hypothetical protein